MCLIIQKNNNNYKQSCAFGQMMSYNWSWFPWNFFEMLHLNCLVENVSEHGLFASCSEYIIRAVMLTNWITSYCLYTLNMQTVSKRRKMNSKSGCLLSRNIQTSICKFYKFCKVLTSAQILHSTSILSSNKYSGTGLQSNQILLYLRMNSIIYGAVLSSNKGLTL